jgi:hypothetical protein
MIFTRDDYIKFLEQAKAELFELENWFKNQSCCPASIRAYVECIRACLVEDIDRYARTISGMAE